MLGLTACGSCSGNTQNSGVCSLTFQKVLIPHFIVSLNTTQNQDKVSHLVQDSRTFNGVGQWFVSGLLANMVRIFHDMTDTPLNDLVITEGK